MGKGTLVAFGVALVACFTLASALSVGFYLHPYEPNPPTYELTHESAAEFDETIANENIDTDDAIRASDLSPDTRRAFRELQRTLPAEQAQAGWHAGDLEVCQDAMVVCDAFEEPPAFSSHADGDWMRYTLIEQDGERYLVATQASPTALFALPTILTAPVVVVFSALLILVGVKYRDAPATDVYGMAALGVVVGLWPYVVMATGLERYWLAVLLLLGIGIAVLGRQLYQLFQQDAGGSGAVSS